MTTIPGKTKMRRYVLERGGKYDAKSRSWMYLGGKVPGRLGTLQRAYGRIDSLADDLRFLEQFLLPQPAA